MLKKITWLLLFLGTQHAYGANESNAEDMQTRQDALVIAHIHTNHGNITVELDRAKAPLSVDNFVAYARAGFYDGTIFHRVIPGFMIQGGGLEPGMKKKKTRSPINNEAENGLKNSVGTIAMARTGDPHSATSQFFVNVKDNEFLNHRAPSGSAWGYAVFGRVTEGMDVVTKIKNVKTGVVSGRRDVPLEDVIIEKVTVK